MKRTIIAALMLTVSAPALAAEYNVNSQITDVIVHPDTANITRQGTITLPAGKHTLIFSNLPQNMAGLPFRLSADGASLGKVTAKHVSNDHDMDSRRAKLGAQLADLEIQKQALHDQIAAAQIQIDVLKNMGQMNSTNLMMTASSDPAKWQASLDAMSKGAASAFGTMREVKAQLPEIERKIETVEDNISHLGDERRITSTLVAEIEVTSQTTLPLTLNYLSYGVWWGISHDVRADSAKGTITIQPKAEVKQSTGEDWTGVTLTLSTSQPSTSSEFVGELPRYLANLEDPRERIMAMRKARAPMESAAQMDDMAVTGSRAQTVRSDYGLSYTWNAPYSLKSGGEADSIDLTPATYQTTIFARITPEFSTDAFLVGRINVGDEPLLEGTSNIYLDGAYVGEFALPETHKGGTALIPLGADRQIKVNRVVEKSKEGDAGLFGSKRRDENRVRYDITNNHPKSISVEVLDARPTALHEDIKIEDLKSGTKPTAINVNDIPGHITWKMDVKSGETSAIRNHYSITYPADKRLDIDRNY